jgi:hypothetical protein
VEEARIPDRAFYDDPPSLLEALLGKNMIFTGYFSLSLTSVGTLLLLPAMAELGPAKELFTVS